MAVKKLDDRTVRTIKAPSTGRLELWDTLIPGFGIRVTNKDARTYFVMYRVGSGQERRQKRLKIGNASIVSLADARSLGRQALELASRGIDPAAPQREAQSEVSRTFAEVAAAYLTRYVDRNTRPSTARETRRILERDVTPLIGAKPIVSVSRSDLEIVLDAVADRGANIQSNRTLTRLRTLFNWAMQQEYISTSPVARMKPRTKERSRDRALNDSEIKLFWNSCEALGWPFGPLFQLLLLTAQRRDEVATMEWSEVDFDARRWVIPRAKAKNDRAHEVPLSDRAITILSSLPKVSTEVGVRSRFVFTTNCASAVSGFGSAKRKLDKLMEAANCKNNVSNTDPTELEHWILHDLRRTAATGMARSNVPPHIVDKILNHTSGTIRGVAAIYNRYGYIEERRAALEDWGRYVDEIAGV